MRVAGAFAIVGAVLGCTADAPPAATALYAPRCPLVGDYTLTATLGDGRQAAIALHAPDPLIRFRPGARQTEAENREYARAWFVSEFETELAAPVPALGLDLGAHTTSLANPDQCTLSIGVRSKDGDLELELTVAPDTGAVTGSLAGEAHFEPVEGTITGTVAPRAR